MHGVCFHNPFEEMSNRDELNEEEREFNRVMSDHMAAQLNAD